MGISQNYPYSSETEADRAAAIDQALSAFEGLQDRIASDASPIGSVSKAGNGAEPRWWTWVCPKDVTGRLHVAGYARDKHALYTVCDACGTSYLR